MPGSVSEKRNTVYSALSEFAANNNSSLQLDIRNLDPNSDCWVVKVGPINEYIKNLDNTLKKIKKYIGTSKDGDLAKNKSRSLKILNELLGLIKNPSSASEDFLNDAEKLSNKLKKIGRLSFLGSFGASLNSGKSIKLLNSCGILLGEAIKRTQLQEKRIKNISDTVKKKTNNILNSRNLTQAKNEFNGIVSTTGSNWIFNDCCISTFSSTPPEVKPWKPERIKPTEKEAIKERLFGQLTKLKEIINSSNISNSRYSDEFKEKVNNALDHVNLLNR